MPELSCPKCGGLGRIPRTKINTRLVCKKCHVVFHMTSSGRTALGEPRPDAPAKSDRRSRTETDLPAPTKAGWAENLPEFTVTKQQSMIALGVLAVVVIGYVVTSRTPESLKDRAQIVAQSFADSDLSGLKSAASNNSVDDVVQWYGVVHPRYEDRQKQWSSKNAIVGVLVIEENARQRSGEVTAILAPAKANEHAQSIASGANESDYRKPLELTLFFVPDAWGKWQLDGKRTYQFATGLKQGM